MINAQDCTELVSVYIPTKNRLSLLKRAIDSVLKQDYKSIELIIVDDGSDDGTKDYLREIQSNSRKICVYSNPSSGSCAARNYAILNSNGKYITGLDDDDYFSDPSRISTFVNASKGHKIGLNAFFDSVTALLPNGVSVARHTKSIVDYKALLSSNHVGSQVFAHKKAYLDAGLFDPEQPAWQDWYLWLKMAINGVIFHNINRCSYVVDESHSFDRISKKSERNIRLGCERLMKLAEKNKKLTNDQRANLIAAALVYYNVEMNFSDFLCLLKGYKLRTIYRHLPKPIRCLKKSNS